ncbi:ATPase [Novosphingobium sp. Gsoil 351]|uniref:ATPase n=1 Tax=Novosphingobium sp. Gsoil 351 TaxID=2675225 RepID=UPI0012B49F50|nr:ATPase [Novosphingobium sp. Gsoil 351]QGN53916.1 ATPase [Novosphingobium sp. Gsoil 351]
MTGNPRIVSLEPGTPEASDVLVLDQPVDGETAWDTAPEPEPWNGPQLLARGNWAAPVLAAVLTVAWSGLFVVANWRAMQAGAPLAQWTQWLATWSLPVALILSALTLFVRSNRREAVRFTDVARALREESAALESRLVAVNGELSLAREFVAAQSRDLESLGRIAVERLSQNADRLAGLIQSNGAQVDAIGTVSANAVENMDKLRGQLPVIANAAKDVTNNIGNAGRTAHLQLQDLANGFHRLNEFGQASERQAAAVRDQVAAAIDGFTRQAEHLADVAEQRFAAMEAGSANFRERLDADETAALAAMRERATRLGEELEAARLTVTQQEAEATEALRARLAALQVEGGTLATTLRDGEQAAVETWRGHVSALSLQAQGAWDEIARIDGEALAAAEARRAELGEAITDLHGSLAARSEELASEILSRRAELEIAGRSAIESLRSRFAEIDSAIRGQRERHLEQSAAIAEHAATIGERLGAFGETMHSLGAHGDEVAAKLERGLAVLTERLTASREALAGTDEAIAGLTDGSVRLLELIQASADHTRQQLPDALAGAEDRLKGMEESVSAMRDALGDAGNRGQSLSDYVIATRSGLTEATGELVALHGGLEEKSLQQRAHLAGVRDDIAKARSESDALAAHVQATLQSAIDRLANAARDATTGLAGQSDTVIGEIAASLGERSKAALEAAMGGRADELVAELEAAVARAASASREAAVNLRDQLGRVDELAGNLERRVGHARERAEEQVDSDFARRAALITESLNSVAIDIAKSLSADVADTAWASYLRGDRGIFTRRAVTLLDGIEARSVIQHYESDRDFRENVNHYIHDFEAMLRGLLSTRDGNALGVTLLSSDMGKLYVAMAQAIERLRG